MRVSSEEFTAVVAAIEMAAASPERWSDALCAMSRLVAASYAPGEESTSPESSEGSRDAHAAHDRPASMHRALELLGAHLETARRLQGSLNEALSGQLAIASLDRLAAAAIVVDRDGTVRHRNAAASNLLSEDGCVYLLDSRIRFKTNGVNKAIAVALEKATQPNPRCSIVPLPYASHNVLEVTISPLVRDDGSSFVWPVPLALLMISSPHADASRIVERVRPLYGLTEAEARVMALLALGATVDKVAMEHDVRTSTVRAQVRSIFEKTGVNRQTDLVRLALNGVPIISQSNAVSTSV